MRALHVALAVCTLSAATLPAQTRQAGRPNGAPLTAEDILDVVNYTVADLTEDGRYAATTGTLRRDTYGTDFRHDGDPTYLHVAPARVSVIDTKSGASQNVFPDKRAVRSLRWAPDGKRLAMLVFNGDILEPMVWERSANKTAAIKVPTGKYVAENSDIRWSADGKQVVVAMHTAEWRKKAREVFANMTAGPKSQFNSSDDTSRRRSAVTWPVSP